MLKLNVFMKQQPAEDFKPETLILHAYSWGVGEAQFKTFPSNLRQ